MQTSGSSRTFKMGAFAKENAFSKPSTGFRDTRVNLMNGLVDIPCHAAPTFRINRCCCAADPAAGSGCCNGLRCIIDTKTLRLHLPTMRITRQPGRQHGLSVGGDGRLDCIGGKYARFAHGAISSHLNGMHRETLIITRCPNNDPATRNRRNGRAGVMT